MKTCETCLHRDVPKEEKPCKTCCNAICGIPFEPWNWEAKPNKQMQPTEKSVAADWCSLPDASQQDVEAYAENRCARCGAILDDGKCWDCIGDGGSRTA